MNEYNDTDRLLEREILIYCMIVLGVVLGLLGLVT